MSEYVSQPLLICLINNVEILFVYSTRSLKWQKLDRRGRHRGSASLLGPLDLSLSVV